jgi:hypothetical protein
MDYPNLRKTEDCPICHAQKPLDTIVCWNCYRVHGFRAGAAACIIEMLDNQEALIARGGSVHLHWKA